MRLEAVAKIFMKTQRLLLLFMLLAPCSIYAQKDTCRVGVYINNLYDFKVDDKSFMADFWVWINYTNDSLQFENAQEITNSKAADFSHFTHEKKRGWNWVAQKCRAQVIHQWDVSMFPFDKQTLQIGIEDAQTDTASLAYLADTSNSKIDQSINSAEWSIVQFAVRKNNHTYATTYGNPLLKGHSSYPGIIAEVTIRRNNSWIKLVKMLTGAYVAFLISCIVFFISSENQDSRFGLCVGGIFAAIGNKYIVESIVPSSTFNTLMDNVHTVTFVFILLIIIIITISLRLFESGDAEKKARSLRIDKRSALVLVILYTAINAAIIFHAAYN